MDIKKYITDNEINIDEKEWRAINNEYPKEEIIAAFKHEILNHTIALPLKKLMRVDAIDSFIALKQYKCGDLKHGNLCTRYDYNFDDLSNSAYIDETNIGNIASDYFQQENRFHCGSVNSPSPYRTWNNERFLDGMLNALWTLKVKEVNSQTFRTCLSLRKYVASQFKPAIVKSIYEKFNSIDILDFSSGWGDRFCGFYACEHTKSYIGIDPNTRLHNKYKEQESLYKSLTKEKYCKFICAPAEEVEIDSECVDTVFTSPPYFNAERYTDENTQSYKRYRKLETWLNNFLFKALDMSISALKKDGHLILNISDMYSGHQINRICDPMDNYIRNKGLTYIGVIGMKMSKRPNSKAVKEGIFVEPIWVWKKS